MLIKQRLMIGWALVAASFLVFAVAINVVLYSVYRGLETAKLQSLEEISATAELASMANKYATSAGELISQPMPPDFNADDAETLEYKSELEELSKLSARMMKVRAKIESARSTSIMGSAPALAEEVMDERHGNIYRIVTQLNGLSTKWPSERKEFRQALIESDCLADNLGTESLALMEHCRNSLMERLGTHLAQIRVLTIAAPLFGLLIAIVTLALLINKFGATMKRFDRIRKAVAVFGQGEFETKFVDEQEDELGQLSRTLGEMAGRINGLIREKEHSAVHDALTGLPNRVLFHDRVNHVIQHERKVRQYRSAVLFCDLDQFKLINDSMGHATGDELLKCIAKRLNDLMGRRSEEMVDPALPAAMQNGSTVQVEISTVARLGGDEFTILLEGLPPGAESNAAELVADYVIKLLSEPISIEDREVVITPSIGIAITNERYCDANELLRDADAALYRAKAEGRHRSVVFDRKMHVAIVERLNLERSIRQALTDKDFVLFYQPIVEIESGEIRGFEALVRWVRGDELIAPAKFIPIAEETGLIVTLGKWAIEEACRQLHLWSTTLHSGLTISVNLSRKQLFDQNLLPWISTCLQTYDISPSRLIMEVTESMFVDHSDVRQVLEQIRAMGVKVYIDDFGTGYSSLSCLNGIPADALKIDKAFIPEDTPTKDQLSVLHAIIKIAHDLNLTVVAEGIESAEQIAMLSSLRCDMGQGYLIARPMSAVNTELFLRRRLATPSGLRKSA